MFFNTPTGYTFYNTYVCGQNPEQGPKQELRITIYRRVLNLHLKM